MNKLTTKRITNQAFLQQEFVRIGASYIYNSVPYGQFLKEPPYGEIQSAHPTYLNIYGSIGSYNLPNFLILNASFFKLHSTNR